MHLQVAYESKRTQSNARAHTRILKLYMHLSIHSNARLRTHLDAVPAAEGTHFPCMFTKCDRHCHSQIISFVTRASMHCDQDGAETGIWGHDIPDGSSGRRHTVMHHQNIATNSLGINLAHRTTKAEGGVPGVDDSLPRQPGSWPRIPDTDRMEARRMTDVSKLSQSSLRASSAGETFGAQLDSQPVLSSPASPILNPSTSSDLQAVHNRHVDNVSASFMVLVDTHSRNASSVSATSGMGRNSSVISTSSLSRFYQVRPLAAMCARSKQIFRRITQERMWALFVLTVDYEGKFGSYCSSSSYAARHA